METKTPPRRRRRQTIAYQWAKNTLGAIVLVLLLFIFTVLLIVQQNYYGSVRNALERAASAPSAPVLILQNDVGLNQNSVAILSSHSQQNRMAVWLYDAGGNLVLSSDGFMSEIPPNLDALAHLNKAGLSVLPSGEMVMTIAASLSDDSGKFIGTVRYIVSMSLINRQLLLITGLLSLFFLVSIACILLTGRHFVRTILLPVEKIADTAEQISMGKLEARVPSINRNDELALLGITINAMAENFEDMVRIKNDFISTISHELRTPITAIHGWSETLLGANTERDAQLTARGLRIITRESARLGKMVDELLDFSRLHSGRMLLNSIPMDVLAELDDVIFTVRETAIGAGITLRQKMPDHPVRMFGDPARLKQVFMNILDNAIKYGGTEIKIDCSVDENSRLLIAITDNGCGIPEEHLLHIKEKFYKADNTVGGSGIGLAVADEIVKMHGGTLEIASSEGEGTRAEIWLDVEK
ncbi:MAG: ATP-binding protein [Oscillospiraceae bacterium]|nr:ATP-binding protein [Oscillospiraceae bacterium]